jgi:tripartite-type tricarboxylate transporter receptor subunit TctC
MKILTGIFAVVIAAALSSGDAVAQSYPSKPVRLVVAFATGGATDTFARDAAEISKASAAGESLRIVPRRTARGRTRRCPRPTATLLFTDLSTHAITPSLYAKLAYIPARDLATVAPVSSSPLIMVAHPSVNVKSAKDLIALAKKHPGITCGNSGIGTVTHMAAETFRSAGIDLAAVNYKGGATSTISLLTGEIALIVTTIPAAIEYVRVGKLVAIGLTADKRAAALPDIPALGETVKGVNAAVIAAVLAPAATPRNVVERLNAEFAKVVDSPKAKEIFAANAAEAMKMSPEAMQQFLEQDIKTWAEVVKATGVKPQ